MACGVANIGWRELAGGMLPAGDVSPSCASQARGRSISAYSESDLDSLFSDVDFKLSQWSATLKKDAIGTLAALPELAVAQESPTGPVYWASEVKSRPVGNRFSRRSACDAGLLEASTSALLDLAARNWFTSARVVTGKHECIQGEGIRGVVMVRGNIEDKNSNLAVMHDGVRDALIGMLKSVAGVGLDVLVQPCKQTQRPDFGTSVESQAWAAFDFEVKLADENDRAPALALLRLEAATGGALRLLPALATATSGEAGHLVVRVEVLSELWALSHRNGSYDLDEQRKI